MRGNCIVKVANNWVITDTSNCKWVHSCFVGPVGQQQFIFIFWRVFGGGVAPTTGPGEVWAGSSAQRLGRPRVPQVQQQNNRQWLQSAYHKSLLWFVLFFPVTSQRRTWRRLECLTQRTNTYYWRVSSSNKNNFIFWLTQMHSPAECQMTVYFF